MQVGNEKESVSFDLRPSDAINIAVRCKVLFIVGVSCVTLYMLLFGHSIFCRCQSVTSFYLYCPLQKNCYCQ